MFCFEPCHRELSLTILQKILDTARYLKKI
jgi:hypothetical protein